MAFVVMPATAAGKLTRHMTMEEDIHLPLGTALRFVEQSFIKAFNVAGTKPRNLLNAQSVFPALSDGPTTWDKPRKS